MKTILTLATAALLLVGCTTTKVDETPPGSGHYTTNTIVSPKLEAVLTTAGAVNTATAPVNPFSPLITIGLAAITAGASWFAKYKNDKANSSALLLRTVVQGVENSGSAEAKKAIETHAINLGVEGDLGQTVRHINSGVL